ncbi:MAG: serine/threonine-protein kinase [Pseudoxanthomonas sp.]|nr:serine/threonine-protein kinase [Pseudoxanthomonas sp.]
MQPGGAIHWQAIWEAFERLADADPDGQAAGLARLQERDPGIAVRVRQLLAADADGAGPLDRALAETMWDPAEAAWETAEGTRVGAYRLIEPIGEGGMGEVWRAERDDGAYRSQVAVKLLKRGMDTRAVLRRFLQERNILARLEHPAIVRLLDGGMTVDGRPWYAMELVDGSPVTVHAARSRLGVRERVALLAGIADAVGHAHRQLVVHRDLKPGNILVDGTGLPRLLDFGIAKLLEDSGESTRTGTGVRVLSPAYAAPEQRRGEPVGTATDVHGLGLVAFELLTGALPPRPDDAAGPPLRASHSVVRADPDQLARHYGRPTDPRALARTLAGDLDHVLAMALRPEPARRYASIDALAADLRAWLGGHPVSARGDSPGYRLRRFVRRNRVGVAAAAAAALALVVGLLVALWQAGLAQRHALEAQAQALRAEQQAAHAQAQARQAQSTRDFVVSAFSSLDPAQSREGANLRLADFLTATLDRLPRDLADDPRSRQELHLALAGALFELGEAAQADARLAALVDELDADPGTATAVLHGTALHRWAITGHRLGSRAEATSRLNRARARLREADDSPKALTARIATDTLLGQLLTDSGRYPEALALYENIRDQRVALNGRADARSAVDHLNLCVARMYLAAYAAAQADCDRAEALLRADPQAPRARLAWIESARILVESRLGLHERALATAGRAADLIREHLGPGHPMLRTVRWNRGTALLAAGQTDMALAEFRALAAEGVPDNNLLARQVRLAMAEAAAGGDRAAAILEPLLADPDAAETVHLLNARRVVAQVRDAQGRPDDALAEVERALAGYRRAGLSPHDDHALALALKARLLARQGRDAEAAALARHADEMRAAVLAPAAADASATAAGAPPPP